MSSEPRLLCIDVFGAAVLRTVAAAGDVFAFAAREVAWRYGLSAAGLADARREAERRARLLGRQGDLAQIYALFPLLRAGVGDALLAAECDVEVALAAAHPQTRAEVAASHAPIAFIDAGPLPSATLTRVLRRAGYADPVIFPSVETAAFVFGVPRSEVRHLAGEPRDLTPSGLGELESLCRGLVRLFEAGRPDPAARAGYALGPRLVAGVGPMVRAAHLDGLDPARVEGGMRAFSSDFAAACADLPWLRRADSLATWLGRPQPAPADTLSAP